MTQEKNKCYIKRNASLTGSCLFTRDFYVLVCSCVFVLVRVSVYVWDSGLVSVWLCVNNNYVCLGVFVI